VGCALRLASLVFGTSNSLFIFLILYFFELGLFYQSVISNHLIIFLHISQKLYNFLCWNPKSKSPLFHARVPRSFPSHNPPAKPAAWPTMHRQIQLQLTASNKILDF
jgi:hypothetical protein